MSSPPSLAQASQHCLIASDGCEIGKGDLMFKILERSGWSGEFVDRGAA
jgi:hypothetical protein